MAKVKDCPGFETFGKDVQTARETVVVSVYKCRHKKLNNL